MPKVNEPQRVVLRGKTRTIGEPRRPIEGSGTVKERAAVSTPERRAGVPRAAAPATSEQGTARVTVGEPKAPDVRTDPTRPLARIEALETRLEETLNLLFFKEGDQGIVPRLEALEAEVKALGARVESLFVLLEGDGIVDNGRTPRQRGLAVAVDDHEASIVLLAESVGDLRQRVAGSDTVPPSAVVVDTLWCDREEPNHDGEHRFRALEKGACDASEKARG